jgi:spoIIIJ-associated protein
MNPYERRIIHSALQNDKFVETYSEGEEPYRKVVINVKKSIREAKPYNKPAGNYRNNNYGKDNKGYNKPYNVSKSGYNKNYSTDYKKDYENTAKVKRRKINLYNPSKVFIVY